MFETSATMAILSCFLPHTSPKSHNKCQVLNLEISRASFSLAPSLSQSWSIGKGLTISWPKWFESQKFLGNQFQELLGVCFNVRASSSPRWPDYHSCGPHVLTRGCEESGTIGAGPLVSTLDTRKLDSLTILKSCHSPKPHARTLRTRAPTIAAKQRHDSWVLVCKTVCTMTQRESVNYAKEPTSCSSGAWHNSRIATNLKCWEISFKAYKKNPRKFLDHQNLSDLSLQRRQVHQDPTRFAAVESNIQGPRAFLKTTGDTEFVPFHHPAFKAWAKGHPRSTWAFRLINSLKLPPKYAKMQHQMPQKDRKTFSSANSSSELSPSPHKSHWLLHPTSVHPLHIHQPKLLCYPHTQHPSTLCGRIWDIHHVGDFQLHHQQAICDRICYILKSLGEKEYKQW